MRAEGECRMTSDISSAVVAEMTLTVVDVM